jgi:error-prone DNA polymerase
LFQSTAAREQPDEGSAPLPEMPLPEEVVADYQTIRLSLKGHPMEFLRPMFTREGVIPCAAIAHENDKRHVRCAGVVLVRQRPGSSKGVVFMTLEDETGIANIVVWPKLMEKFRKEVMGARLIEIDGTIQSSPDHVVHLVANRLFDRTPDLIGLSNDALRPYLQAESSPEGGQGSLPSASAKARHPRQVRILPASRDFH